MLTNLRMHSNTSSEQALIFSQIVGSLLAQCAPQVTNTIQCGVSVGPSVRVKKRVLNPLRIALSEKLGVKPPEEGWGTRNQALQKNPLNTLRQKLATQADRVGQVLRLSAPKVAIVYAIRRWHRALEAVRALDDTRDSRLLVNAPRSAIHRLHSILWSMGFKDANVAPVRIRGDLWYRMSLEKIGC